MALFIAFICVLVVIGIFMVLRSGGREIILDEKDREVTEAMKSQLDKILPPSPKPPGSEEESWTMDSVEDASSEP